MGRLDAHARGPEGPHYTWAGPRGPEGPHYLFAFVIAALCLMPSAQTAAQQEQTSPRQGLVRKGKVPVSTEVLKIRLPKPVEADLANGLHLMVLEDHRLPQLSFQIFVPGAGGYFDPPDQSGLASFAAALMREGTASRTSEEISHQLDVMAANLTTSAGTSGPEATISGSCLSDQFEALLDLTADVLLHPSFPEQELARYKQRTRAQLIQQRANPNLLAYEMFSRAMYPDHPASRVTPTVAALDAVTKPALTDFHRARYVPDHAAIAIAGDVTMADARRLVEAKLGPWKKANVPPVVVAEPAAIAASKIYFVGRPNSVQTTLIVGTPGITRTSGDYDVLQVMNKILGGGPTGRLFIHLREEKGYTYGIGSSVTAPIYRGDWSASTSVRTEVTDPALQDLLAEIAQMRDQPVSDEELNDARRAMIASFALSLESPPQLLNLYVTRWRYNLAADYWDRYGDRIGAVTKDQIQAAARKYLGPERMQIIAVGDPTRIPPLLKKLGEVETYDVEGKRVGSEAK